MKKWFGELSDRIRKTIITAIAGVILSGIGYGSPLVFAMASDFNSHIASHEKKAKKKRIHVLEEQMLEYREMFEDDLKKATEKQKKRYRKWEIEAEILWKEMEIKI